MWLSLACGEIPITNGQYRQMTIDAVRFVEDCFGIFKGFKSTLKRMTDAKTLKNFVLQRHQDTEVLNKEMLKLSRKKYADAVDQILPLPSNDQNEQYEKSVA